MGGGRALVLVLVAMSLAQPTGLAAWEQPGGSALRSGVVAGLAWPLDVVSSATLTSGGSFAVGTSLPLVVAEGELVGAASTTITGAEALAPVESCELVSWAPGAPPRATPFDCPRGAVVVGHAPRAGLTLACVSGTAGDPVLQAWERGTMRARWSAAPAPPAADAARQWDCGGVAVEDERGRVVVAFTADDRNELVAFDLADGGVLWRRVLPPPDLVQLQVLGVVGAPAVGFGVTALTRIEGGYVVLGYTESRSGALVLDDEGNVVRGIPQVTSPTPDEPEASPWPAAQGARAAFVLGGDILLVDATGNAQRRPLPAGEDKPYAPPAWWSSTLLVPRAQSLQRYDLGTLEPLWPRSWRAPDGGTIEDLLIVAPGSAAVLWDAPGPGPRYLSRLELSTSAELQRIPLDVAGQGRGRLLPLEGGSLVAVFASGEARLLAPASAPRPTVRLSEAYPAVEEAVALEVDAPGAARVLVAWGDGAVDELTGAEATHQYQAARPHRVSVTAVMADGRTATAEMAVHVGATPPETLTAIQRAFAPERQEATFFLLGLALTGGGALFAALLRRRRQARLAEEERRLRDVIEASLRDPTPGLAALESHRARLRDQHTRRRLDDAQYQLLDHRAVRAMKSARYRLLGPSLNKLAPHFRRVLDTALEDGNVTTGEMAALVEALDEERALGDAERERVRALLVSWSR